MKNTAQANHYLILIFGLLSVFIKLYQISYRSFFQDELYSVSAAFEPSYNKFIENWVLYDSNPPLYYFFLRFWLKIVPATEFWVRLPSVIFILIASFIFIRGIKKRFQNFEWFYLLLFIGCCYGFLFFAQEARAYGLLLLLTCLQLLQFIDLLKLNEEEKKINRIFGFALLSILSSYTHYTGIVFSGILYFILIFEFKNNLVFLKKILLAILISLMLGIFWVTNFLFFFHLDKSFIIHQKFSIIKSIIPMLFFGYSTVGKVLSMICFFLFLLLLFFFVKKEVLFSKENKVIISLGLTSIIILILSPFIPYFFSYRHYIVFIPIILLSFSVLLSNLVKISEIQKSFLLIVGIVVLVFQSFTHYKSERENWRQAVNYCIKIANNEKTKVIVIGEPWEKTPKEYLLNNHGDLNLSIRRKTYYLYYFNQLNKNKNIHLIVLRSNNKIIEEYIENELKTKDKVIILSYTAGFSKDIQKLNVHCKVIKKQFYGHVVYYCFKNKIITLK